MMIEQLGSEDLDMSGATAADRELSGKLYAILTSHFRGSALQFSRNFVRTVVDSGCGRVCCGNSNHPPSRDHSL